MISDVDGSSVCQICLFGDSEGSNLIVFCEGYGCKVAVHQKCYGIKTIPEGDIPWLCNSCENRNRKNIPLCILCKSTKGAMKQTIEGYWAHIVCALSFSEVFFDEPEGRNGISGVLTPSIYKFDEQSCAICKKQRGSYLKCSVKECNTFYHAICQQQAGYPIETSTSKKDKESYCKKHISIAKFSYNSNQLRKGKSKRQMKKKKTKENPLASLLLPKIRQGKEFWQNIHSNYLQDVDFLNQLNDVESIFAPSNDIEILPLGKHYSKVWKEADLELMADMKISHQKPTPNDSIDEGNSFCNNICEKLQLTFHLDTEKIYQIWEAEKNNGIHGGQSIYLSPLEQLQEKNSENNITLLTPHQLGYISLCTLDVSSSNFQKYVKYCRAEVSKRSNLQRKSQNFEMEKKRKAKRGRKQKSTTTDKDMSIVESSIENGALFTIEPTRVAHDAPNVFDIESAARKETPLDSRWDFFDESSQDFPDCSLAPFVQLEKVVVLQEEQILSRKQENDEISLAIYRCKKQLIAVNSVNNIRFQRLKSIVQPFCNRRLHMKRKLCENFEEKLNRISFQCFGRCLKCLVAHCKCQIKYQELYGLRTITAPSERGEKEEMTSGLKTQSSSQTIEINKRRANQNMLPPFQTQRQIKKQRIDNGINRELKQWVQFKSLLVQSNGFSQIKKRTRNTLHPVSQDFDRINHLESPEDFNELLSHRLKKIPKEEYTSVHISDILEYCKAKCVRELQ